MVYSRRILDRGVMEGGVVGVRVYEGGEVRVGRV